MSGDRLIDITHDIVPGSTAVWPGDNPPMREVLMHLDNGDTVTLSGQELNWLLDGYDLSAMRPHKALDFQAVG